MIRALIIVVMLLAAWPAYAQLGDPSAPNAITDPLGLAMANAAAPQDGPPTQQNEAWSLALYHYATNITTAATAKANAGLNAMAQANINYVVPFLRDALVLLLLVELSTMLFSDGGGNPLGHILRRVFRYTIIITLIANLGGGYQAHVVNAITGTVDSISNGLTGALGAQFPGAAAFEQAFNSSWAAVWTVVKTTPLSDGVARALFIYILCALAFLVIALAIAAAFVTWLSALLALKIGFAVGPLFIAAALAPQTKGLFDAWLGVVGSSAATQVFAVLIMSLLGFADQATTASYLQGATGVGNNPLTGVEALVIMGLSSFVLGVFVFYEAPRMAARLFSGIITSAAPFTAAAAGAMAAGGWIAGGSVSGAMAGARGLISGGPSGWTGSGASTGGGGGTPSFSGAAVGGHYRP